MVKFAVVVALFAVIGVAAAATYSFSGNVTLANNDQFAFRNVGMGTWNLIAWSGAYYYSVDINAKVSGTSVSGSLDSLWGAAYVGLNNFPITTLAYFNADASLSLTSTNWLTLDVSGSAGYLANSYIGLTEKDSNGNIVAFYSFKDALWTLAEHSSNNGLHWATFQATVQGKYTAKLTYFASEVVGTVAVAGTTVVTPRTLESVFAINNYQYASNGNSVTLSLGVASGSATASTSGVLTSGSGSSQMYIALASEALVGNELKPVSISSFASATLGLYFNDDVVAQVNAKYSGSASAQIVNVTFPAGATSFEYDPTIGNGQLPQISGGIRSVPAVFLLAAVMAVKLFF